VKAARWRANTFIQLLVRGVRKYLANQEERHRRKSFDDEFEGFMKRAGFQRFFG
jgi:hypothetical protein